MKLREAGVLDGACDLAAVARIVDEYKFATQAQLDPVENWVERAKAIPIALEKAIIAKNRYWASVLIK